MKFKVSKQADLDYYLQKYSEGTFTLVKVSKEECPACKRFENVIEKVEGEFVNTIILEIEVRRDKPFFLPPEFNISCVPTTFIFKNEGTQKRLVKKIEGFVEFNYLSSLLKEEKE